MSDFDGDEYQYEWPDDGDNNDGWGQDGGDDGNDDPYIQVENQFYEAEDNMKDNPKQAIEQFKQCIEMEENLG